MNDVDVSTQLSKYEEKRRKIKEEEARQRREALNLSSGDENDYENFIPARQKKREKVKFYIENKFILKKFSSWSAGKD